MRKMKDSGIEWIGKIPENWGTSKIKHFSFISSGESISKEEYVDDGLYSVVGANGEIGRTNKFNNEVQVITTGRVGTIGSTHIFSKSWITDNVLILTLSNIVSINYVKYAIPNFDYKQMTSGTAMPLITATKISNETIPFPTLSEQTAIAAYLDTQCAHIDSVIEKTKQSIEEYKKLKQAVITQAVTKGVRGKREMKGSGVEWIGDIPKEWEVSKLKRCAVFSPKCDTSQLTDETIVEYLPMEYVKKGTYTPNTEKYSNISNSLTPFQNGDIIFAKVTPCFENGNIAILQNISSGIGFGSSELYVIRTESIDTAYMFYWLQNIGFINAACATMTGTGGLKRVSSDFVKNSPIAFPPIHEQNEIAAYLDQKCAEIDTLITKKEQFLTELESYKKSMIYEYVTGKKEVL